MNVQKISVVIVIIYVVLDLIIVIKQKSDINNSDPKTMEEYYLLFESCGPKKMKKEKLFILDVDLENIIIIIINIRLQII